MLFSNSGMYGLFIIALCYLLRGYWGIGELPGDLYFRHGRFTFYFPFMSALLIHLLITFLQKL